MRVGIIMPVVLVQRPLLEMTCEAVAHLRTRHDRRLYVICNGLHVCLPAELQAELEGRFEGLVRVINEPGIVRSVARSWNAGGELALADGADYLAIIANDTRLRPDCLDLLVAYGERVMLLTLDTGEVRTADLRCSSSQFSGGGLVVATDHGELPEIEAHISGVGVTESDGVLVGTYFERLGRPFVEGGELGQFGEHSKGLETGGHPPRLDLRIIAQPRPPWSPR